MRSGLWNFTARLNGELNSFRSGDRTLTLRAAAQGSPPRIISMTALNEGQVGGAMVAIVVEWTDPDGCAGLRFEDTDNRTGQFRPPNTWDVGGVCGPDNVGRDRLSVPCGAAGVWTYRWNAVIDPTGLRSAPASVQVVCRA